MCIYNVYEPVWHSSLWNKRLYELCPICLNTVYLLYTRQECRVCSKNGNKCNYRYPRCYPLEKIVSDDSWHIPGFLSTLSNCWTQTSLMVERLNGYSRVCFSQPSWIFTRDGSAFNFQRDATLIAIWAFPSGLKQGKILILIGCVEERRHGFHALKKKKDLVALGTHPHPNKYIHLFSFVINITQYVAFSHWHRFSTAILLFFQVTSYPPFYLTGAIFKI